VRWIYIPKKDSGKLRPFGLALALPHSCHRSLPSSGAVRLAPRDIGCARPRSVGPIERQAGRSPLGGRRRCATTPRIVDRQDQRYAGECMIIREGNVLSSHVRSPSCPCQTGQHVALGCCRLLVLGSDQARSCVVPWRKAWSGSVLRRAFMCIVRIRARRQRVLWDCGQRRHVTGADIGEVAEVDGGDRGNRRPLAHRDHGSVGPVQVPVGVASRELSHAAEV
jgi:hypothetical protein